MPQGSSLGASEGARRVSQPAVHCQPPAVAMLMNPHNPT